MNLRPRGAKADFYEKDERCQAPGGAAVSALLLLPALPARADTTILDVSYIFYTADDPYTAKANTNHATQMESGMTAWGSVPNMTSWFAVDQNITITDRITVTGEVHLILCDCKTLTATNGITVAFSLKC